MKNININNELYNSIELIWKYLSQKYNCSYIYITGSNVLDYVKEKHDIDIVISFPNRTILKEIREDEYYQSIRLDVLNKYKAVFLLRTKDMEKEKSIGRIWSYELNLIKDKGFMFGNYDDFDIDFDFFKYKNLYMENARSIIKQYNPQENELHNFKFLYHILTGMYIIQNNSYDLTEEQINNINIVHDCKEEDKQKILELYENVKEWLGITQES